ncbi:Stress Response and Developmental Protein [Abortiporus biennis]
MSAKVELDPYTAKAQNDNLSPHEKIEGLHAIVKAVKTGMMTTRSADGSMHSRAMAPSGPHEHNQVNLFFIANNASHKFDEIQNDDHVNVSFYDEKTTNWASYSGVARVSQDKDLIEKHWSSLTSAWFGDLGDNVHKGDRHDPRVSIIEIIPSEIRYWVATRNAVGRAVEITWGAATGKSAAPGELRTISSDEIQLIQGLHKK